MGWEYSKSKAKCQACGKEGARITGSDDWCRSSTSWEGFENCSPNDTAVARKRVDSRDSTPLCSCGSTDIITG